MAEYKDSRHLYRIYSTIEVKNSAVYTGIPLPVKGHEWLPLHCINANSSQQKDAGNIKACSPGTFSFALHKTP